MAQYPGEHRMLGYGYRADRGCGQAINQLFRLPRFPQTNSLFVASKRYGIQRTHSLASGEEFGLSFAEGDLRLLAGSAVYLCHNGVPEWTARLASNKKVRQIA
jgi:hypothetical protein